MNEHTGGHLPCRAKLPDRLSPPGRVRAGGVNPVFLTNLWYMAAIAKSLKRGAHAPGDALRRAGFARARGGGWSFRPARYLPAPRCSAIGGELRDGTVECPYHGWRFTPEGQCAHIPSVLQDQNIEVGGHPCAELSMPRAGRADLGIFRCRCPRPARAGPAPDSDICRRRSRAAAFCGSADLSLRGRSRRRRSDGSCAWSVCSPGLVVAKRRLDSCQSEASRTLPARLHHVGA